MKQIPFWTEDAPRPAELAGAQQPDMVDVAVIGSGYTGLNAAITLAKHGATVAVLEQKTIGWGASSRNGGMMTTGLKEEMPAVVRKHGLETARELWRWAVASIDHVEQQVRDEEMACDFVRSGHALLAYKPTHFAPLRDEVAWFAETLDYHDLHVVGTADLRKEIGTAGYYGAIVDTNSAAVHPAKYVFGLAGAAARHGVELVEEARVTKLERRNNRFLLSTPRGALQAHEVLIATNGYTTDLAPAIRKGVFPVGSYIIATEPLPPRLQQELSPKGRMFFDSKHFLNYFRLTPDGRMLFGGRHNLAPNLDLVESAHMMRRRMVEVYPQLADVPLSHTWSGRLGLTFDLMPHAGRLSSGPHRGVHFAYGYAGHGVSVASYLGYEMGEIMAGRRTDTIFQRLPQQRHFFTRYDRLYLPLVSSWFRLLDAVG